MEGMVSIMAGYPSKEGRGKGDCVQACGHPSPPCYEPRHQGFRTRSCCTNGAHAHLRAPQSIIFPGRRWSWHARGRTRVTCSMSANGGKVHLLKPTRPCACWGSVVKKHLDGPIISTRASAQCFADWAHLAGAPQSSEKTVAEGVRVEHNRWSCTGAMSEVELVTIHGGGHGLPQPYARRPRPLGPSPMDPVGSAMIWAFFERQPK